MAMLPDPEFWLESEFERRRAVNVAYSLRAFARSLGLSPGRLSEYLNRKRPITPHMATKLGRKLGQSPQQNQQFINSCSQKMTTQLDDSTYDYLDEANHQVIADNNHYLILNLIHTNDFQSDEKWIAQRLGMPVISTRTILKRLLKLGLIATDERDRYFRTGKPLRTSEDKISVALRQSHKQSLNSAIKSLEDVSVELRDISSTTVAIDMRRLPEAKRRIRNFRRRLAAFLAQGDQTEVYEIGFNLVPLTKPRAQKLDKDKS